MVEWKLHECRDFFSVFSALKECPVRSRHSINIYSVNEKIKCDLPLTPWLILSLRHWCLYWCFSVWFSMNTAFNVLYVLQENESLRIFTFIWTKNKIHSLSIYLLYVPTVILDDFNNQSPPPRKTCRPWGYSPKVS